MNASGTHWLLTGAIWCTVAGLPFTCIGYVLVTSYHGTKRLFDRTTRELSRFLVGSCFIAVGGFVLLIGLIYWCSLLLRALR